MITALLLLRGGAPPRNVLTVVEVDRLMEGAGWDNEVHVFGIYLLSERFGMAANPAFFHIPKDVRRPALVIRTGF